MASERPVPERQRVVVLLDCPAKLRPSLGRVLKGLGRRHGVKVVEYREAPAGSRLTDLGKKTAP